MNAIDRIRDFAIGGGVTPASPVSQGIPTLARSFGGSRTARLPSRRANTTQLYDSGEPSEQDMGRVVRPYGFIVRIDADAARRQRPALKLLRLSDRSQPVGVSETFASLMAWLAAAPRT